MAGVTVRTKGRISVDMAALERRIPPLVVGFVLDRLHKGLGMGDAPLAPYSASYLRTLALMGEGPLVDLRLTGGMLNSLRHTGTERLSETTSRLVFGVGTGTSPQVRPPTKGKAPADGGRARPKGKARAKRTGQRGPAWNLVASWLHHGTSRMRPRPWLGLGPAGLRMVARAIEAMRALKS